MPKRPCTHPGCGKLVDKGRCEDHPYYTPQQDRQRGTAAQRGYSSRWRRYRRTYLSAHPLCVMCEAEGRTTAATVVDHIQPVTGADDPLFWEPSNHQSLCRDCHAYKTREIDHPGLGFLKKNK